MTLASAILVLSGAIAGLTPTVGLMSFCAQAPKAVIATQTAIQVFFPMSSTNVELIEWWSLGQVGIYI